MSLESARHETLKTIARGIIRTETRELIRLRALRTQWFGSGTFKRYPLSDARVHQLGMGGLMAVHEMMDSPHFDHVFLNEMIPHNGAAIVLAGWELASGTRPPLKAIAAEMIGTEAAEIGTISRLALPGTAPESGPWT